MHLTKNYNKFTLLLLIAVIVIMGCEKVNKTANPSIRLMGDNTKTLTFEENDSTVNIELELRADAGIKEFTILTNIYNADTLLASTSSEVIENAGNKYFYKHQFEQNFVPEYFDDKSIIELIFNLKDNNNITSNSVFTIKKAPKHFVIFIVKDSADNIISDATIKLGKIKNEEGNYEFLVLEKKYDYEVSKKGYKTATGVITVENALTEEITLEAEENLIKNYHFGMLFD